MTSATLTSARAGRPRLRPEPAPPRRRPTARLTTAAFAALHFACLGVLLTGATVPALVLCAAVYLLHMFGITAGFHRYFSHRAYKTSRPVQFLLAWLGCSAGQRGPLWWAARHRHHHRTSDTPDDLHSPVAHGPWHAHLGWLLSPDSDGTDLAAVRDLARFPELRWLDRYHWVPFAALAALCYLAAGWAGLVWGGAVAGVLSHHATFTVNSLCHLWGRRRFPTPDDSRNNLLVALLTLGEGWHNNHHHRPGCAAQGLRWYELDVCYLALRALAALGLVWDLRRPSGAAGAPAPARQSSRDCS